MSNPAKKKYFYTVKCPVCGVERVTQNKRASRCSKCAGKQTYVKPTSERNDARRKGDGYVTKQGYHLIYDGSKYVPAHRLAANVTDPNIVVHHVDGNKLNNDKPNLHACSKAEHREIHGQLERISYFLIQNGMIEFDSGRYKLSTSMKKFVDENSVNSGKPLTVDAEGNPEPSPVLGRCNDYPLGEYSQAAGSAEARNSSADGYDIVSSALKDAAAPEGGDGTSDPS